jgi:hypothetical protein
MHTISVPDLLSLQTNTVCRDLEDVDFASVCSRHTELSSDAVFLIDLSFRPHALSFDWVL